MAASGAPVISCGAVTSEVATDGDVVLSSALGTGSVLGTPVSLVSSASAFVGADVVASGAADGVKVLSSGVDAGGASVLGAGVPVSSAGFSGVVASDAGGVAVVNLAVTAGSAVVTAAIVTPSQS